MKILKTELKSLARELLTKQPNRRIESYRDIYGFDESDEWALVFLYEANERIDKYILYDAMDICGCGNPGNYLDLLLELLELFSKDIPYENNQRSIAIFKFFGHSFDETATSLNNIVDSTYHILLNVLERGGLIEHGGYIGNGLVTEYGKILLKYKKLYAEYEKLEDDYEDADGI